MKVSDIIANVEYQRPRTTKDCRDGWTESDLVNKLTANPDPKARVVPSNWNGYGEELKKADIDVNPDVSRSDWTTLRDELSKGIEHVPLKGKISLVG